MGAKLVAEEGVLKGLILSLENGTEWTVGRDPVECQLVIEDPAASRKHLHLRTTSEGILLENLSETNPVLINNEEVKEPKLLHEGDALKIGEGLFRFYTEDAPEVLDLITPPVNGTKKEGPSLFEEGVEGEEDLLADVDLDISDTAPWMLKVVAGPNSGAQVSLHTDTSYTIGNDPATCDIVFHDVSVSRQHARLTISKDNTLNIEDLQSSNGTMVDNHAVKGKEPFKPSSLISCGTTSFVIFDKEGQRTTIISPLLPAIVRLLQDEQEKKLAAAQQMAAPPAPIEKKEEAPPPVEEPKHEKGLSSLGYLILVGILTGIFLFVGLGTAFLFHPKQIVQQKYDVNAELSKSFAPYPSVRWSFNPTSGRLILVGHVLNGVDRDQLIHNLNVYPFISSIDNNIVVDENIWQEFNQVLTKNPDWRGVSIHSYNAGHFILTGYVQTNKQKATLTDYISQNFPFLDLLDQKVYVESNLIDQAVSKLKEHGFTSVTAKVDNGDLILSGDISFGERPALNQIADSIKTIPGIRDVKTYVTEMAPVETMVDLTNQYQISGSLSQAGGKYSVVINGQLLNEGDTLDGKRITKIDSDKIFLESNGVKYKIEYNK